MSSFKCHVCGGEAARNEFVSEVFTVEGRRMLVEHIRRLVHGAGHPIRTEPLEVFALA
jgi:hypothetical protein